MPTGKRYFAPNLFDGVSEASFTNEVATDHFRSRRKSEAQYVFRESARFGGPCSKDIVVPGCGRHLSATAAVEVHTVHPSMMERQR